MTKAKKIFTAALLTLFGIALISAAVALYKINSKPILTNETRQELGGTYITLEQGVTHYELFQSSEDAPLVVLVPGLTVPMAIFRNNVEALQKAGYSTLRYDFFGRGLSDRPRVKYNAHLYAEQTRELLDSLAPARPIHLIGISLGSAVAAKMVVQEPSRYRSLIMVDAAVAFSEEEAKQQKKKVLNDRLKAIFSKAKVDTTSEKYAFSKYIQEQFKYRGVESALFSISRNSSPYNYLKIYQKFAKLDSIPTQIIWGEDDDNFPLESGKKLGELLDHAEFHIIPEGSHTPHFGAPEKVNPILVDFLNRVEEKGRDTAPVPSS